VLILILAVFGCGRPIFNFLAQNSKKRNVELVPGGHGNQKYKLDFREVQIQALILITSTVEWNDPYKVHNDLLFCAM